MAGPDCTPLTQFHCGPALQSMDTSNPVLFKKLWTLKGATKMVQSNAPTITPFLWFDGNAEEAMNFYISIFEHSKVISRMPGPNGTIMGATFQLNGQELMAFNGGPEFKFTEAISFFVHCETQEEVDNLWQKLSAGGEESRCGWLKDKFGLSWQIIPNALGEMLGDKDPERAQRVMQAMLQMSKIDISTLKRAYEQT